MQNVIKQNINKGLLFENINVFVPWGTAFDEINKFGKPSIVWRSDQRTDAIWENVEILGGVKLNITATFWRTFFGTRKFCHLISYLESLQRVEELKAHLDEVLSVTHKRKNSNALEFYYKWKVKNCTIRVGQGDRFGTYYYLSIDR